MFRKPEANEIAKGVYQWEENKVTITASPVQFDGVEVVMMHIDDRYPSIEELEAVSLVFWDEGEKIYFDTVPEIKNKIPYAMRLQHSRGPR